MPGIPNYLTRQFQDFGETILNKESLSGNAQDLFDQIVALGTDVHYAFNVVRSQLLAVAMLADQDVTIGLNGSVFSSPPTYSGTPIELKAGRVYGWSYAQDGLTVGPGLVECPFTVDVTDGIYITALASPPGSTRVRIKTLLNK
jgi:hypothetical protein